MIMQNKALICQYLVIYANEQLVKGLVHPKMKILSVFTHPHVVQTP